MRHGARQTQKRQVRGRLFTKSLPRVGEPPELAVRVARVQRARLLLHLPQAVLGPRMEAVAHAHERHAAPRGTWVVS